MNSLSPGEMVLGTLVVACFLVIVALVVEKLVIRAQGWIGVRRWRSRGRTTKAYRQFLARDCKQNLWSEEEDRSRSKSKRRKS